MRSIARANGFSLIELMIAITIIAIFLLLAMPSFSAWLVNTRIRNASESIANGLQVARNEAVRRNASVQFVKGAGTDSSWVVNCVAVTPGCPDINAIQSRSTGEGSSADITVTPSSGNTVVFDNFGMKTTPAVATISFAIDTTSLSAAESRDLRVTVDAGGNVRMCDPNTTAPDPRAC
jgi:type IV fimbrial biogenesis protein FimT